MCTFWHTGAAPFSRIGTRCPSRRPWALGGPWGGYAGGVGGRVNPFTTEKIKKEKTYQKYLDTRNILC